MHIILKGLAAAFLLIALDIPWLLATYSTSQAMFSSIQGSPLKMRIAAAIPVYAALSYLLLQQTSVAGAAASGLAVYAVYDFTNLAVFKNYTLEFAVADTIWGGILFATSYYILHTILRI
jgi:uncharacterized membrane protein